MKGTLSGSPVSELAIIPAHTLHTLHTELSTTNHTSYRREIVRAELTKHSSYTLDSDVLLAIVLQDLNHILLPGTTQRQNTSHIL